MHTFLCTLLPIYWFKTCIIKKYDDDLIVQLELRLREMHSSLRLWSTLVEKLRTYSRLVLSGATCLKELFNITERFFWENRRDASEERSLCTSSIAHNVGGSIDEWFTSFFL